MTDVLRYFLPAYFALYFGIAFVLKSLVVARRTGRNPLVLPKDDSAYGLVGFYFKLIVAAIFIYVFLYAFLPDIHPNFLPIQLPGLSAIASLGIGLLLVSLLWTAIAQHHMKDSWRIGIDTSTRTELVTGGLFSISRNPIFFGMTLTLTGLFLATPNALTLIFLVLGHVLIQIQIRLEEDFLAREHGQAYLDYKRNVRRMIGKRAGV